MCVYSWGQRLEVVPYFGFKELSRSGVEHLGISEMEGTSIDDLSHAVPRFTALPTGQT